MSDLVQDDLKYVWHPCSQMQEYVEHFPPLPIVRGHGSYLVTEDGREILDIISSWWCNLLGHCNPEISEALAEQAKTLEHVIFANFTHPWAVELCRKLKELLPEGLCHFNFADNGSSAVEMSLKLAFQYQQQIGECRRIRFACLTDGYHGETIGALAVGSMDLYTRLFKPMLMDALQVPAPDCFNCPYGKKRGSCSCECLEQAEKFFKEYGECLCALICEPLLQGAGGMRIYPEAYLRGLRRLCTEYGVLLICDEIATGFGRTGEMFASLKAKICPDLMCLSKALTAGYLPMSIVAATEKVYKAFYAPLDDPKIKGFVHSHTYAGNPLGCVCALTMLKILERDEILKKAKDKARFLTGLLEEKLKDFAEIGEIRHLGLIHAMPLVKDKESRKPLDPKLKTGYRLYQCALSHNLLLRNIGDLFYFNPPLNIDEADLEKAVDITVRSLKEVLAHKA